MTIRQSSIRFVLPVMPMDSRTFPHFPTFLSGIEDQYPAAFNFRRRNRCCVRRYYVSILFHRGLIGKVLSQINAGFRIEQVDLHYHFLFMQRDNIRYLLNVFLYPFLHKDGVKMGGEGVKKVSRFGEIG
jgi:hypothetical protein